MRPLPFAVRLFFLLFCTALFRSTAHAAPWFPFGPDGGDARALAADPHDHRHLFLGTVNGALYESRDGGGSWHRLTRVGQRDDLVIDNVLVDPADSRHIYVAAFVLDHTDGGLYMSSDGGKSWTDSASMRGHSIRALSMAPSDPKTLVAGALDGVFRSSDAGKSWTLISPAGSTEIHEIQSIAIDPVDPRIIYAGTWHLPWKTIDGGEHWNNVKEGIIDDSDVFSIIVDPHAPATVYASACSGIYKSTDAGDHFSKVQGIPSTARRTRVLTQDPKHANIVFAGTTEGLFRTSDAGKTWMRNSSPELIINDVYVDPEDTDHVLLTTDRNGVLLSTDGGFTFSPSNKGFSARQIAAYLADRQNPGHIWVGVVNDKQAGGVFFSDNGGLTWQQQSDGLGGADIFSLAQTPEGAILAGTRHGLYRFDGARWQSTGLVLAQEEAPPASKRPVHRASARDARRPAARSGQVNRNAANLASKAPEHGPDTQQSSTGVFAMLTRESKLYAATEDNLLVSTDDGRAWKPVPSLHGHAWRMIASEGPRVFLGDRNAMALSIDGGASFSMLALPSELTVLGAVAVDPGGRLWAGGREGIYLSEDNGGSWHLVKGLFVPDVNGIYYDRAANRLLITSNGRATVAFGVSLPELQVRYWETGWKLRMLRPVGDHLIGVTAFDGVVLEPRMVNSEETAESPAARQPSLN